MANLFTLTPPTASGREEEPHQLARAADVNAIDLSFDAREIVFSAQAPERRPTTTSIRINVDGTNPCDAAVGKVSTGPCQITDGRATTRSIRSICPAGRIFYVTNQNVEGPAVPQFRDEYERATTAQVAHHARSTASGEILGPRNVSHRVVADAALRRPRAHHRVAPPRRDQRRRPHASCNQDMTGIREGFGREGKGLTNAYLRAHEVSPGQIVAIGTSRDRTFQAGKIVLDQPRRHRRHARSRRRTRRRPT